MSQHPRPRSQVIVLILLLILALASWIVTAGSPGITEAMVALGIGVVKAALVLWWFMNLRAQGAHHLLAVLTGAALTAILIGLIVTDVALRPENHLWYRHDMDAESAREAPDADPDR